MTFAIITPALITGATADRLKFGAYAVFIGVWLVLVYAPIAHMVFAGGWLADMGALDFAGGAVVHMNAGAAALAVVLVLGRRKGWPETPMPPHNLPMTVLGTGILWFGWAGFNAGSALAADGIAAQAIMNTFLAASAAMLGWLVVERIKDGHATTLGGASGAVAGLVAITPVRRVRRRHGARVHRPDHRCGVLPRPRHQEGVQASTTASTSSPCTSSAGSSARCCWASSPTPPSTRVVNEGVFLGGGGDLLIDQIVASVVTLAYSFVVSLVIAKVIDVTIGLRDLRRCRGRGPRPVAARRSRVRGLSTEDNR